MAFVNGHGPHGYTDAPPDAFTIDHNAHHLHQYQQQQQLQYQELNPSTLQEAGKPTHYHQSGLPQPQITCDTKPRLTKEQHDVLEAHYKRQNKPNTNTKKTFADALNVSLDKVNNWFQNRRAKSKQDLKKQNEQAQFPVQTQNAAFAYSDTESSPAFPAPDYFSMMQDGSSSEAMSMPLTIPQHTQAMYDAATLQASGLMYAPDAVHGMIGPNIVAQDMYDSPLDMHRRTLTQEQFDAFTHHGVVMANEQCAPPMQEMMAQDEILRQMFPDSLPGEFRFPVNMEYSNASIPPSLSSNDSSVPSTLSEQPIFPVSSDAQERIPVSSEMPDGAGHLESYLAEQMAEAQQSINATAHSQWQPGQSVPVDPSNLQQQFREVEQQQAMQQQQQSAPAQQEQQWPDESFMRRDSHSSAGTLAQQMSNFGIETPVAISESVFKTPTPPASIAARRQRPRPAALGLASLRSQSYSGAVQPSSPSHLQQQMHPGQALRRIRSSNVINGIAAGRVGKSLPAAAQRSPLNFTFAEGISSPKAIRHASTSSAGTLAPPTPLSPSEAPQAEPQAPMPVRPPVPRWQSSSGHVSCQASISETDAEHKINLENGMNGAPGAANFTSPPHTPSFQQTVHPQFLPPRTIGNPILENTPPQSAPACQQSFAIHPLVPPPPMPVHTQPMQMPPPAQPTVVQPMMPQAMSQAVSQPMQVPVHYQLMSSMPQQMFPEQYNASMNVAYAQPPAGTQFVVPTMPAAAQPAVQYQFTNGVPVLNEQGQMTVAFPQQIATVPQMHFVQQPVPVTTTTAAPVSHAVPAMTHYTFSTAEGMLQQPVPVKPAQPASELFVHEYSPPQDMKRAAIPRKMTETGPKNYTFANQGPEHFEKDKLKKAAGDLSSKSSSVTSESPESGV